MYWEANEVSAWIVEKPFGNFQTIVILLRYGQGTPYIMKERTGSTDKVRAGSLYTSTMLYLLCELISRVYEKRQALSASTVLYSVAHPACRAS